MTRIPASEPSAASPNSRPLEDAASFNELQIDDFFGLMIAELQNQDPLNPLDNHQMLQQISQIREVGATDKLTETLEAVLLGQNVASATGLIGTQVRAATQGGETAIGVVDRITIVDGTPKLHLRTDSRVEPHTSDGELEAGTYRYKVTFQKENGDLAAVELGPIATTGTNGLDAALRLSNLPVTPGPKTVYRTDASGNGDYHLVGVITSGDVQEFVDPLASADLPNSILTDKTVREFGGREITVDLNNVQEVRRRATTGAGSFEE